MHAGPTPHHNHWLDVALAAFKHRLQCQYLNALSSSMASLHWNQRSEPQMSTSQLLAQTLSSHLGEPRRQYSESPATCHSNTIKRLNANIGLQLKSCLFVVVLSVFLCLCLSSSSSSFRLHLSFLCAGLSSWLFPPFMLCLQSVCSVVSYIQYLIHWFLHLTPLPGLISYGLSRILV